MDIQTKKWRVQDHPTMPGHYEVSNRHHVNTVKSAAVPRDAFPNRAALDSMSEAAFDRAVVTALKQEIAP